ncbi:hypothetical protein EXIGLDRAFT_735186 [Exidia glandulosa HHB12029]|uniref:Uncharacterized protein n=1 Tax=Exidia glandulosa HHB12029 TaxID=1314781 RepID=A0A165JX14_EXIGL|nr:hypothetical protein EXIGLDRAFT_735186 [Exidia glandulosa HHB12029]
MSASPSPFPAYSSAPGAMGIYAAVAPVATPVKPATKGKPLNVFSDDGLFLERFQRNKMEDNEKKKQEDELKKKREFDARFKNRRKRPAPTDSDASRSVTPETAAAASAAPAKKVKTSSEPAEPLTAYQKEVKSYSSRSLKEDNTHIGSRSLVR